MWPLVIGLAATSDMAQTDSKYVVVARRKKFSLAYPRHLWNEMTDAEQKDVIARQAALFDEMAKANAGKCENGAVRRSKVAYV